MAWKIKLSGKYGDGKTHHFCEIRFIQVPEEVLGWFNLYEFYGSNVDNHHHDDTQGAVYMCINSAIFIG